LELSSRGFLLVDAEIVVIESERCASIVNQP
jgi:hypothetical protein